jgi:hypothetical protein
MSNKLYYVKPIPEQWMTQAGEIAYAKCIGDRILGHSSLEELQRKHHLTEVELWEIYYVYPEECYDSSTGEESIDTMALPEPEVEDWFSDEPTVPRAPSFAAQIEQQQPSAVSQAPAYVHPRSKKGRVN